MKILIAPDSFKGSLSAKEAGRLIATGIKKILPDAETEVVPMADGGEGTLEMMAEGLERHEVRVSDPLGRKINSYFLSEGNTAYIEMAETAGLTLLKPEERNPGLTHTYGLGEQIKYAFSKGFRKIVIFAGGSATNDAGLGALSALGFQFYGKKGHLIKPCGENLIEIVRYESPKKNIGLEFVIATDVTNPFYGTNGATYVYAPQKGASPGQIRHLEAGIKNIASLFTGNDIQNVPGAGAAGGLAGGFHLFLDAKVVPATNLLFEKIKFNEKVARADLIITGEGKIDAQSLSGKLVSRILNLNKPTILIAGEITENLSHSHILFQTSLKTNELSSEEGMANATELLKERAEEIGYFIRKKLV